jgi:hypothetical protein
MIMTDIDTLAARDRQRWVDIDMDETGIRAKPDLNDMSAQAGTPPSPGA